MAAADFLSNYASPSFTHSSLLRAIAAELPPRKSAFSDSMTGALRLLRLWVLTHFIRDFWRARMEGKFPGCMFGKMRRTCKRAVDVCVCVCVCLCVCVCVSFAPNAAARAA